nr:reverse transcriptase domain-containing protein [Tanacetum cinerariifolium]
MQTRSSSRLIRDQSSNPTSSTNTNPKGHNRRGSKQRVENSNLEEHLPPVVMMADQSTMAELLRAPTEGYAEAIVVSSILAEQFELKYSLINMMTTNQFFRLEKDNPHDHIRWGSPPMARKRTPAYKDLIRACPHHGFTELHQLDTFYNALNPADQDSLNAAAGGNLLERSTQDALTIIENKSTICNSRSKPIVSQVKACDVNSNSEIAKLTHVVNQQTSAVTTAMTAMLKQFQATPPPAPVKAFEEICVTCGGFAQPNVQNNQNRFGPPQGFNRGNNFNHKQSYQATAQQNQNVHLNELEKIKRMNEANMKAMQTQIDMVKNELINEMKSSIQTSLSNQTNEIKNMMAGLLQMNTASTSGSGSLPSNTVANPKGEHKAITTRSGLIIDGPTIPTPPQSINLEVDERVEETFTDSDLTEYTIKKMLKALMSNKEKLQELANTHLNENCSAVILKKLPKKLGDPGKFLIPCGFSELKCKALAKLGASINLMPLSVWKKLGLPELIPTCMTLKLANCAICTPAGIARNVFVPVGKFTFPADFVIVDYESDSKVPLILGRPFLRTARALIDVHDEEMILCDEGCNALSEKLPDLDSTKDLHSHFHDNPLSGSTTYFSNSLLEEFTDEIALITCPPEYDDNLQFDIESDLKEIEFLLYQDKDSSLKDSIDQKNLANLADIFLILYPRYKSDAGNVYDVLSTPRERKSKRLMLCPSTNNEDKIFNPCILIQEKPVKIITRVVQDKKLANSNASLVLEDFDPPFYEPLFFKEASKSMILLPFSSENEKKVFKPGIHTSEKVHS